MHQSCLVCLVLESEEGPDLTSPFTSCESLCVSETVWMVPTAVPVEQQQLGQSSSDYKDRTKWTERGNRSKKKPREWKTMMVVIIQTLGVGHVQR